MSSAVDDSRIILRGPGATARGTGVETITRLPLRYARNDRERSPLTRARAVASLPAMNSQRADPFGSLQHRLHKFPLTSRYLIGVSGGRDSVALLHWLVETGYRDLIVCHLNHQLRGRSARADARFVENLARGITDSNSNLQKPMCALSPLEKTLDRNGRAPRALRFFRADGEAQAMLARFFSGITRTIWSRLF